MEEKERVRIKEEPQWPYNYWAVKGLTLKDVEERSGCLKDCCERTKCRLHATEDADGRTESEDCVFYTKEEGCAFRNITGKEPREWTGPRISHDDYEGHFWHKQGTRDDMLRAAIKGERTWPKDYVLTKKLEYRTAVCAYNVKDAIARANSEPFADSVTVIEDWEPQEIAEVPPIDIATFQMEEDIDADD